MKRLMAMFIAVCGLCGCKSQLPTADPFRPFGQTTVEPPGTGAASGGAGNVGYSTAPPRAVVPLQPVPQPGAAIRQPSANQSGQFSPWTRSRLTQNQPPAATLAGRERVIRILQPRPGITASPARTELPRSTAGAGAGEPRRLNPPTKAVDIMDLPKPASATSPRAESSSGASGFRLVSGTQGSGESALGPTLPTIPTTSGFEESSSIRISIAAGNSATCRSTGPVPTSLGGA